MICEVRLYHPKLIMMIDFESKQNQFLDWITKLSFQTIMESNQNDKSGKISFGKMRSSRLSFESIGTVPSYVCLPMPVKKNLKYFFL